MTAQANVYRAASNVSAALARAGLGKTRSNEQQRYKFRGIDEVMNALSPLLVEHGLMIIPRMLERTSEERQTKSGGAMFSVTVAAEFDFVSVEDGSAFTCRTYGEAMDTGDKATNKAMAVAYKYAAFQTFCIPTEGGGDVDADAVTHEEVKPRALTKTLQRSSDLEGVKKALRGAGTIKALSTVWKTHFPGMQEWPQEDFEAATICKDACKVALAEKAEAA